MSYELSFYKADLGAIRKIVESESIDVGVERLFEILDVNCQYVNGLQHSSGCGGYFYEYINTIAADYFSEQKIYELFMSRNDLVPSLSEVNFGYLKYMEMEQFILATQGKDKEVYFEDNDDFEEDLDVLEEIFLEAVRERKDIICIYS